MTVKRLVFIRPGETDWNRDLRWQGWVAIPLNAHGRIQAERLANFVRHIGMSALYTSDLRRALETAGILSEKLGFAPIPDARLRERNIGTWQGLKPEEMQSWYAEEYSRLMADPDHYPVPGGESRQDVRTRMRAAFEDILAQDKGETIGVISHTSAIKILLSDIVPGGVPAQVPVSNSSVTTIVREDDVWKVVALDDVLHLEGLESKTVPDFEEKPHDLGH